MELTLTLPKPHSAQAQVIREARRFNVVNCGRRFGKTKLGENRCIRPLLDGYPVGWFAPSYKYLHEVWHKLRQTLAPITRSSNATDRRIELLTGGVLEFWTLDDQDAGRSRKYKRVIVDEAAKVAGLEDIWGESIRPTLTDYAGDGWFLSTPKGMNFFRQCFDWGQDPERTEWISWRMPTAANPYIEQTEIEAARQELPDRIFRQEYLAEFIEDAGGVFRRVRAAAALEPADPYPGEFVMGVDWAQKEDFTVLAVLDRNTRKMVDLDRFNQVDWAVQRSRLWTMAQRWNVQAIIAEENSIGGPNIEQLQREGLPVSAFQTTATSKPPLIESLGLAFERSEIEILNDPVLVAELESYERTVSPATGRSRYSAPAGYHDDTVMALALAWHAVQQPIYLVDFA